jgi:uncharacterized protein (TIGR03000 family)
MVQITIHDSLASLTFLLEEHGWVTWHDSRDLTTQAPHQKRRQPMFQKAFLFGGLLLLAGAAVLVTPGSSQAQHHGGGGHGGSFHSGGFHHGGFSHSGFNHGGFNHGAFSHGAFHHGFDRDDFRHGAFHHGFDRDFRHDFHHGFHHGVWWFPGSGWYPGYYGGYGASPYNSGYYPYSYNSGYYPYDSGYYPYSNDSGYSPYSNDSGYSPYSNDTYSNGSSSPAYDPGYYDSYGPLTSSYPDSYSPATAQPDTRAHITVSVPADAALWFNDTKSTATGAVREYASPPLTAGDRFTYDVRARWNENGHEVTQTQQVEVTGSPRGREVPGAADECAHGAEPLTGKGREQCCGSPSTTTRSRCGSSSKGGWQAPG